MLLRHLNISSYSNKANKALSEIAGNRNLAYRFTVRFRLPAGASLARSYVEALVEAEKPAFAGCTIEINGA